MSIKTKKYLKENYRYVALISAIVIICAIIIVYSNITNKNGITINHMKLSKEEYKISVYIDGEINKQGVIKIPKGKNLEYAIDKAGGITEYADIQNLDFKRKLKNGEKIFIPKIKEESLDYELETLDKININKASKEELIKLDGIGEKTAERIIEYRNTKSFESIEEITCVKGIGDKKFEKIKEYIVC